MRRPSGWLSAVGLTFIAWTALPAIAHAFPGTYQIRLFNTDDAMNAFVDNASFSDQLAASSTFAVDNITTDITAFLVDGPNVLSFELTNIGSGYTWGIELRRNAGTIIFSSVCGTKNVVGCDENSQELFTGMEVSTFRLDLSAPTGVPEPATLLLMGAGLVGATALRGRVRRR